MPPSLWVFLPEGYYSRVVKAGDFLFIYGQVPIDPKTGDVKGETIEEQTRLTLQNTKATLEAGKATLADVIKVSVVLTDMSNYAAFNTV